MIESRHILGLRVDATTYSEATAQVLAWAEHTRSCYVCCAAANNIMEARASDDYREVMRQAALVTSDGMPLVWLLRLLGLSRAVRVYGPDLMPAILEAAAKRGAPVGFYGGTPQVLARLIETVQRRYPGLRIAYAWAPPFRALSDAEDHAQTLKICDSGVRILFVGLGSPKQDRWMHARLEKIPAVMLGVGAAFDFVSGSKPQAPPWMQRSGLEWLFRLCTEPARLWRRYLTQNPKFAVLAAAQLVRTRLSGQSPI